MYKMEYDENGNKCILSDFPELVSEFGKWLKTNQYTYKEIYEAFSGGFYQEWSD